MERDPFTRAWQFLNYKPGAKWTAQVAAVATAVLYLALLIVLALFVDLVVSRGRIPTFRELPAREQAQVLEGEGDPDRLSERDKETIWHETVRQFLAQRVSERAAERVAGDPVGEAPPVHGILSLVVRSRDRFYAPALGRAARLAPWTWDSGNTGRLRLNPYLTGLLGLALALAILRALALFAMHYTAAAAAT